MDKNLIELKGKKDVERNDNLSTHAMLNTKVRNQESFNYIHCFVAFKNVGEK